MPAPVLPRRLADLTPEWLTAALQERGVLREARVRAVRREDIGEGEGFLGQLARLHLELDRPEDGAPRTLVAKLPTPVRANRATGEMLGAYEREILFYEELSDRVPIRVPRSLYAAMDPNPLADRGPAFIASLDRMPIWLVSIVIFLSGLFARFSRRRYVLLLEDLAPARVGDQLAGAPPETCERIVANLAQTQAAFWESPELERRYWLNPPDLAVKPGHMLFSRLRGAFADRYLPLHPEIGPFLDLLGERGPDLVRAFSREAPHTLLHADFRLDNLFFDARGVIAADWQSPGHGPGAYDVAYFLSSSLPEDAPRDAEIAILRAYHTSLMESGVRGYDDAHCRRDYERALALCLYRLATVDQLEMGEARGATLVDQWVARTAARLGHVDAGTLL